jgi:nucleoside 2-deoxyribosyltransferase
MNKPIDRAIAKEELERINEVLDAPHLLIGGLAVQQYYSARLSKDIDLVCDFETAQRILDKLYPSRDWMVQDKRQDEYRPSFRIKHRFEEKGTIIFGPKISERAPYNHLDWESLQNGALPFRTNKGPLNNILVPSSHALAYTKFISFLGRQSPESKVKADLKDLTDLTNYELFSASSFYDLLRKTKSFDELIDNFRIKCKSYSEVIKNSCLYGLAEMFDRAPPVSVSYAPAQPLTVYIAAPHKNIQKNERIQSALQRNGFSVKLPFEEVTRRRLSEDINKPEKIRAVCIEAIDVSQFVAVDLDTYGLDTAWELGYAEGLGKRIVGFNKDLFLTTDERYVNRRRYDHNFMHGWGHQKIFSDLTSAAKACENKVVYICGSFANSEIERLDTGPLVNSAKKIIFPKNYVDNQNRFPKDYPLAERGETNRLLADSDIVLVALPRYGMDSSWQIGFATAKGKTIFGVMLKDDGVEFVRQSFWDHWMHGWKSKIRVTGSDELCSVLLGFTLTMKQVD